MFASKAKHCQFFCILRSDGLDNRNRLAALGEHDLFARAHHLDRLGEMRIGLAQTESHAVMNYNFTATDPSLRTKRNQRIDPGRPAGRHQRGGYRDNRQEHRDRHLRQGIAGRNEDHPPSPQHLAQHQRTRDAQCEADRELCESARPRTIQ